MDWKAKTVQTYDDSATQLADYFKGIGARIDDIELALKLAIVGRQQARVVEIGCGDGRDAKEIVARVSSYEGFDPSESLLKLARRTVPGASFVKATAQSYEYQPGLDVVYAFASLLHVDINEMPTVLEKVHTALRKDGILLVSLKERETYTEEVKKDEYGERMFYYYNPAILKDLVGSMFSNVHEAHQTIGKTQWFTVALKRN
jgi:SAM-dependent methyltransferase